MADSVIRINKSNGRLLGAALFLCDKDIGPFISPESTHLRVEKILMADGIFLKVTPEQPILQNKRVETKCTQSGQLHIQIETNQVEVKKSPYG